MKPKILLFIDWYKPGYKAGGPIQSIGNLVSQLHSQYNFYIVTRNTDYLETIPYTNITSDAWNNIYESKIFYLSPKNSTKSTIKKLINEVNPEIIYCNSLYSPKFTLLPIQIAKKLNIKTLLAVRGMLSEGSLSVKSYKKKVFLRLIKGFNLFSKTIFHATSLQEKNDIIANFGNNAEVIIAQNLPEKKNIAYHKKQKEVNQLKLVIVGRISPEKNTLYALEILREVKTQINFDIYGPIYNPEYWQKCKKIINQLPSNIVVNYKGVLPHDKLEDTLIKYHVFFSPSTGENFGHSIIEGMVNSCVPIISDKTPWKNLKAQNIGFDIDLKQKTAFTNAIHLLAKMEEKEFNVITKNTYNYAQTIINNSQSIEGYHKLFST